MILLAPLPDIMHLTRTAKRVLYFVDREYPIPWTELDEKRIIAIKERPLANADSLASRLKSSVPDINMALDQLIVIVGPVPPADEQDGRSNRPYVASRAVSVSGMKSSR